MDIDLSSERQPVECHAAIADDDEDIGKLQICCNVIPPEKYGSRWHQPVEAQPEDVPVPFLPEATQIALINNLRERAYEGRRKKQEAALLGLRVMWAKTWVRMSSQSQSQSRKGLG